MTGENRPAAGALEEAATMAKRRDFGSAIALVGQVLRSNPADFAALQLGGDIAVEIGKLPLAAKFFGNAAMAQPSNITPRLRLAETLTKLCRFGEAERIARELVVKAPQAMQSHLCMARVHDAMGDVSAAVVSYRRAIDLSTRNVSTYSELATTLVSYGDFKAAETLLRQAIDIEPRHGKLWEALVAIPGVSIDVEQLRRLYADATDATQRIAFAFSLARSLDRAGTHEEAMAFYIEANGLKRAELRYSIEENRAMFSDLIAAFDPGLFATLGGSGATSETPIFIVGMPRSGTSLVEQILASHPEVSGAGELQLLGSLVSARANIGPSMFTELVQRLRTEDLRNVGMEYLTGLREVDQSAKFVTDKLPGNFILVGFIHLVLPRAKVIHVRRDPVDTCLSIFKGNFGFPHPYAYDLTELGDYYTQYSGLMKHWDSCLPGRILGVDYEQLIASPETEIRRMLNYCGLPWSDSCLNFHETDRAVRTLSAVQIRQPMHRRSIGTAARYGHSLDPLYKALGRVA